MKGENQNFPHEDENIKKIFDLNRLLKSLFFKGFEDTFNLPEGMNFTHMRTLLSIRFHSNGNMTELSHIMLLEKGSFSTVAARLINLGLVEKVRSQDDRRVYILQLTVKGKELADHIALSHVDYIRSLMERLEKKELDEYYHLIDRLIEINLSLGAS